MGPKAADLNGHLCIFKPTAYKTGIVTSLGEAEAIECDIVDLDANEEHYGSLLFNTALRSALKPLIGQQVLARIGQGVAKPGKSAPWILLDAASNTADVQRATAYLAGNLTAPAGTPPATPAAAVQTQVDVNDPAIQAVLAQLGAKPF